MDKSSLGKEERGGGGMLLPMVLIKDDFYL